MYQNGYRETAVAKFMYICIEGPPVALTPGLIFQKKTKSAALIKSTFAYFISVIFKVNM